MAVKAKADNGRRRWQIWLGEDDFKALRDIMRVHGQQSQAEAVRFAVQEQVRRDREKGGR